MKRNHPRAGGAIRKFCARPTRNGEASEMPHKRESWGREKKKKKYEKGKNSKKNNPFVWDCFNTLVCCFTMEKPERRTMFEVKHSDAGDEIDGRH